MTQGKICSQMAHATLSLYKEIQIIKPELYCIWASLDYPIETFEANSYEELVKAVEQAKWLGLAGTICHDAGRTQVQVMSGTVCAIGPCPWSHISSTLVNHKHY